MGQLARLLFLYFGNEIQDFKLSLHFLFSWNLCINSHPERINSEKIAHKTRIVREGVVTQSLLRTLNRVLGAARQQL